MSVSRNKKHRVINKKMLVAGLGALSILVAIYLLFSYSGSDSKSSVHLVKAATRSENVGATESEYILNQNEDYRKHQEKLAQKTGNSYMAEMGSVNPISIKKPPLVKIDAKDSTTYDYKKELAKRQKKAEPKTQTEVKTQKVSLSPEFEKYLDESDKDNKKNKIQRIGFETVVKPDEISDFSAPEQAKDGQSVQKILAGTTLYGVLKNKINSDFKDTPVVAEVTFGGYRGATFVGKFSDGNKWVSGVSIKFTKMIYKGFEFSVNAIATNADYQPELYDDIDNHWFMRIGGLVAGAGLGAVEGAASPYIGANRPTVIVSGGGETNSIYTPPDTQQVLFSAAGGAAAGVAKQLAPVFTELWNRPPTVTVDIGHGIGIMFTQTLEMKEGGNA